MKFGEIVLCFNIQVLKIPFLLYIFIVNNEKYTWYQQGKEMAALEKYCKEVEKFKTLRKGKILLRKSFLRRGGQINHHRRKREKYWIAVYSLYIPERLRFSKQLTDAAGPRHALTRHMGRGRGQLRAPDPPVADGLRQRGYVAYRPTNKKKNYDKKGILIHIFEWRGKGNLMVLYYPKRFVFIAETTLLPDFQIVRLQQRRDVAK